MAFGIVNVEQIERLSGFTIELADVTNATATAAGKKVNLTWDDPSDVILEGATLAKWAGTLVVRKANSPPTDKNDGTVVVNSTTRNAYSTTPLQDTNLENGVIYYYRFFPYSANGTYTSGTTVSAKPSANQVAVPTITADFTYDGTTKTPTFNYDSRYVATGDLSATNAGEYKITFSIINDNYIWSDGTFSPKTVTWSIAKAAGRVSVLAESVKLTPDVTSETLTITQTGDGELSVESGASAMVVGTIDGSNLIITRVGTSTGTPTGTCQMTVKAAESNNYTAAQVVLNVTVLNYKIMTVKIYESNSNPATCCTYADNAVDMEPGSAEWDEFFGHYPCLFQNGVEGVKLNPNNFGKNVNGNSVTINSTTNSNDVMIAFPRRGLKMSKTGNIVTISMTDDPDNEDFEYMAHKRGDTLKDKFYLGAYMATIHSSKLRSLKGQTIMTGNTIGKFREQARANGAPDGNGGSGYDQHGWYQLVYLQAMYVLKYKNLDSQTVIGRGFVGESNSTKKATGGTENKGMDWGETTGTDHMKLFGIEDLWGNVYSWIDGIWSDANRKIWTATENFNSNGSGYTDRGSSGLTDNTSGYLSKIQGDTHKAFLIGSDSGTSGSATTYFTDHSDVKASSLLHFGSDYNDGDYAGAFTCHLRYGATSKYSNFGTRLMYL